jgi:uronate dehydrogenase
MADLCDPAFVDRLLADVDVLIHMAATSAERPLPEVIENNLRTLHAVYEGARRHRVRRIVFASSNHAVGMHSVDTKLDLDCELRPDGWYGLSKVGGEAMTRMHWDKHGIEGISLRIGSAIAKPTEFRHPSTWLGYDDLVQLITRCVTVPDIGYMAVWGVSANTRSYWNNAAAARLGYRPTQNAEDYAAEILSQPNPLDPVAQRHQGSSFVTIDYTPPDQRPPPPRRIETRYAVLTSPALRRERSRSDAGEGLAPEMRYFPATRRRRPLRVTLLQSFQAAIVASQHHRNRGNKRPHRQAQQPKVGAAGRILDHPVDRWPEPPTEITDSVDHGQPTSRGNAGQHGARQRPEGRHQGLLPHHRDAERDHRDDRVAGADDDAGGQTSGGHKGGTGDVPGPLAMQVGMVAPVDHRDEGKQVGQCADQADIAGGDTQPFDDQRQEEHQPVA